MGVLGEIILKLGWDPTFWWQLGILLSLFFILKYVLFDKLLWVLEHREEKTVKLAEEAAALDKKTQDILDDYNARLNMAREEAQVLFRQKREEWAEIERTKIEEVQEEINAKFDEDREGLEQEFAEKRNAVMQETKTLSNKLVEKLTN